MNVKKAPTPQSSARLKFCAYLTYHRVVHARGRFGVGVEDSAICQKVILVLGLRIRCSRDGGLGVGVENCDVFSG